jgi:hypothetical protein
MSVGRDALLLSLFLLLCVPNEGMSLQNVVDFHRRRPTSIIVISGSEKETKEG